MAKYKKTLYLHLIFIALGILLIVILLIPKFENNKSDATEIKAIDITKELNFANIGNATAVRMFLPAVDNKGQGAITELVVNSMPGSGKVFVDINNLIFWQDTQQSIRTARNVAANIAKVNISKYDLFYNIYANAAVIGGPSAGSGIAIATIAALEGKSLNRSVMITGTIEEDGSIGIVGGILEKSMVARATNASLFLVPEGQANKLTYSTTKNCSKYGIVEICSTDQDFAEINITDNAGIDLKEVKDIKEALSYFIK